MAYIMGQILGLIATAQCIIEPFFKKKWQMLVNEILENLFMALNYLLIGSVGSAFFMCMVAVAQSFVSFVHTRKETKVTLAEKGIFFVLYVGCGFYGLFTAPGYIPGINFQNMLELLPIIGAVLNMITVFVRDEQKTRKFLLLNALVWCVYTAVIMSTTFFAEFFAAVSTGIALYKYRARKVPRNKDGQ